MSLLDALRYIGISLIELYITDSIKHWNQSVIKQINNSIKTLQQGETKVIQLDKQTRPCIQAQSCKSAKIKRPFKFFNYNNRFPVVRAQSDLIGFAKFE